MSLFRVLRSKFWFLSSKFVKILYIQVSILELLFLFVNNWPRDEQFGILTAKTCWWDKSRAGINSLQAF